MGIIITFRIDTITDSFRRRGNSSLFQIELISQWTSERGALPPVRISCARSSPTPGDLYLLNFPVTNSTLK